LRLHYFVLIDMPPWKIHIYWCKKLGIHEDIANEVNLLIDFPRQWIREKLSLTEEEIKKGWRIGSEKSEYISCRENLIQILVLEREKALQDSIKLGHDFGRRRKWQIDILLICAYEYYGIQGVKAAILHHILDYIEGIAEKCPRDLILHKIENKFNWLTHPPSPKRTSKKYYEFSLLVSELASDVLSFVKKNLDDILVKLKC